MLERVDAELGRYLADPDYAGPGSFPDPLQNVDRAYNVDVDQPLSAADARKLAKEIIETGSVVFTKHAEAEMAKDKLAVIDATNVLRGGAYSEAEWENGAWRHHALPRRSRW